MSEPTKKRIVIGESGPFGCPITAPVASVSDWPNEVMLRWRHAGDHFVLERWNNGWTEVPCELSDTPEKMNL